MYKHVSVNIETGEKLSEILREKKVLTLTGASYYTTTTKGKWVWSNRIKSDIYLPFLNEMPQSLKASS